ncbi:MAG: IclR family transcriptional regulator [Sphingomonas sanxanigenens]|uniref:IclR family transcriptional regulator n=1 Tax=Sphingomonas sanxanigenens TaxID=397260 RepID=A0A2W5ACH9_9SPHN|nr:MAG: IclR family transcriptional regulator [Sphingomonas sanxanigenens]
MSFSENGQKYRAPALEKGLDIVELLARTATPLTLTQICTALGRSQSELFRMAQVLEHRGLIAPSPNGDGFILTNRLFELGMAKAPIRSLVEAAIPSMRGFSDEMHQSAHLVVRSGSQMVVVARTESPGDLGFSVRVGRHQPIIGSNSGVVLFAFAHSDEREQILQLIGKPKRDGRLATFQRQADEARRSGIHSSESDVVRGVTDVSAPVFDPNGVAAALTTPFVHLSAATVTLDEAAKRLAHYATAISHELGGAPVQA